MNTVIILIALVMCCSIVPSLESLLVSTYCKEKMDTSKPYLTAALEAAFECSQKPLVIGMRVVCCLLVGGLFIWGIMAGDRRR